MDGKGKADGRLEVKQKVLLNKLCKGQANGGDRDLPTRFRSRAYDEIYQVQSSLGENAYEIESVFRQGEPLPHGMVNRIHADG